MKKALIVIVCLIFLAGCGGPELAEPKFNDGGEQAGDPANNENTFSPGFDVGEELVPHNAPPPVDAESDIIEIKEKLFVAHTNDVYLNAEDYLGKILKYEGMFKSYYYDVTDQTYHSVIRYGPGCCGFDDNAGFEVIWSGEYPEQDDWVEAVGVLEFYEEGGYKYLRLNLSSLTVLDTRGAEYVFQ